MDTGTLIGVVCGVVGTVVVIVVIVVLVCLWKRGRLGKRSSGVPIASRSPLQQSELETSLTMEHNTRPRRTSNGSVPVRRGSAHDAEAAYQRQVSQMSADSHVTTTTPLVATTPTNTGTLESNEVSNGVRFSADSQPRVDANALAYQSQTPVFYPQWSVPPQAQVQMVASVAPYAPHTGQVMMSVPYVPYQGYGSNGAYHVAPFQAYQVPAQAPAQYNEQSSNRRSPVRPWGIVPLLSTDLYLTRNNRSGELVVADLDEATAAHLNSDPDAERASTVDYQHDLDVAASGFSSLPRRSAGIRWPSPTHARAPFARSKSHSLHSINRSQSHTPSILEEPEPAELESESEEDHDYVNVHSHSRTMPDEAPPVPQRNRNQVSVDTGDPPRRPPRPIRSSRSQNEPTEEFDAVDEGTLRSDFNANVVKSSVTRYDAREGSPGERQSMLQTQSDVRRSNANDDVGAKRESNSRRVFEVAL